jgi:hypothetical protein
MILPDRKMDQNKLKKLLEVADPQDQVKLKVLHNAVVKGVQKYNAESISSNLKDWKSAEGALEAFIDALWKEHFSDDDDALPNLLAVVNYLDDKGWKIKKSAAYQHQKEGKIRPRSDGKFGISDVEKYAATFLKRQDGGKVNKELERLQQERSQAETDKIRAQAEHWMLKTQIAKDTYVEKAALEKELTMRMAVFKSDAENFSHARAGDIIQIVNGDSEKTSDLIEFLLEAFANFFDRYAGNATFTVPISVPAMADDIDPDEDEEQET